MGRVPSTVAAFYFVEKARAEYLQWEKDTAPASVCRLNGKNCSSQDPVRSLEGLDCTGPHFDERWDYFYHGLEVARQAPEVPKLLAQVAKFGEQNFRVLTLIGNRFWVSGNFLPGHSRSQSFPKKEERGFLMGIEIFSDSCIQGNS